MTEDMNRFSIDRQFDRVISIEMFEHMRNWPLLLENISQWLGRKANYLSTYSVIESLHIPLMVRMTIIGWETTFSAAG